MHLERVCVIFLILIPISVAADDDDDSPVKTPSLCEVCKFLVTELKERLDETGKSKEVLETGHGLDPRGKKKIKYHTSELRLTEALHEPHICEKILSYNIHAEQKGSNRYAKGMSETMQTLHGLVDKGVKVELGMPYEMWDKPSAEVTIMQRKCYSLVEEYEDNIEEWYYHHQDNDLMNYLCQELVLKKDETGCLHEGTEEIKKKGETSSSKKKKRKDKNKGDTGLKGKDGEKEENKGKVTDKDEL